MMDTKECVIRPSIYLILIALILVLNGCMMKYRNFPIEDIDSKQAKEFYNMTYMIKGGSMFHGATNLNNVFRFQSPFRLVEKATEKPQKGLFVSVKVDTIAPSVPAILFGYISYCTLTLTPFWSTKDGYYVTYEVFMNGKRQKSFTYEIRRKAFVWIVMVPFSWINAFTYSEEEAFRATANRFFKEAAPIFRNCVAATGKTVPNVNSYCLFGKVLRKPGVHPLKGKA
jgi:hypothetical protein